ncbi:MAG TPA: histidine kinase [Parafilimonas sp.]|nr:histidine kinase [Parafilimonas sp.]
MKPALPAFFFPVVTVVNNSKRSWENFFIGFVIIIGIIAQALVFVVYKLAYHAEPVNPGFSFILWVAAISPVMLMMIIIRLRKKAVQNHKHQNNRIKKTILQLEARALRAQMNPHFIFNCMNSIKQLIQQKDEDKAIAYLTAFSKLMRAILQNSDRKEISLFEEIETCRLYTQLESMRFSNKLSYAFDIDETLDLKSVMVPALIMQPFIENAIWHGIMPKKDGGRLTVAITKTNHTISCIIDDDGIGRKMSMQNKVQRSTSTYQSKGIHLTQTRLQLSNALNQRNASVEIIDKTNENNGVVGTKVILVFNEE